MDDQIVWARSPIRFDLAGGWTDTPPYCIEHGGKVLNVAADLNGQPPIQVFAKLSERPELVMRSIDLGVEERVRTYAELDTFARPDSPFALAKAAFALAGFLPRFHAQGGFASLEQQLREFGAGIEISLLAAVPKGSGLGTSSILAATVLAALGDLCGLDWDRNTLFTRTLALEQMLTTGGGWQDQAGAIFRGIKLIETAPGLAQKPAIRWLPHHLFDHDYANRSILLYYTGITRLAKNILAEIVRGIFLNSPSHLGIIADIGANADFASAAIQKCDYEMLLAAIRNSWTLNQRLDAGTNPPEVQQILDRVQRLPRRGQAARRRRRRLPAAVRQRRNRRGQDQATADQRSAQPPRPLRGFQPLGDRPATDAELKRGALPRVFANWKVGRAVLSEPLEVVQFPTFRAPSDTRGAVGTPRPTHDPVGQHALTSAARPCGRVVRGMNYHG